MQNSWPLANDFAITKGQIISEVIFLDFNSSKKRTKFFQKFALTTRAEGFCSFFGRTEFIVLQFFVFFTVVISLVCIHTPAKLRANQKVQLLATGYAPAIFGSTQIMFFKVVGLSC